MKSLGGRKKIISLTKRRNLEMIKRFKGIFVLHSMGKIGERKGVGGKIFITGSPAFVFGKNPS
jgi:hypothetical protein